MAYNQNDKERLAEIRIEIMELANEALKIVRSSGTNIEYHRAKSYWAGHILSAVGDENYISDQSSSMLGLLKDLGYDDYSDSFEDEEEDESEEDEENDED